MPPRLARLLAALVAIALVVAAFALRGAISGDDETTTRTGDRPADPTGERPSSYRLACDADLGGACDVLAQELGGDAVDTLTLAEVRSAAPEEIDAYDAWLTVDPMPAVVDSGRDFEGLPPLTSDGARVEVASSRLAVLTFEGSPLDCGTGADWVCLVEPVRPALAVPSPDTSMGTVILAAGAVGLIGGVDFGINQFRDAPASFELEDLLDDVEDAAGRDMARQTDSMLRPGTASGAITTAARASSRSETLQGRGRGLRGLPLAPEVEVGVVLVGLGADGAAAVAAFDGVVSGQTVRDALTVAGWDGSPTGTSGLPEAAVIDALREDLGS